MSRYLASQWSGGKTFAPAHYRRMLTAFANGVKSVRASALVVSAGTAPFGDPAPNGRRIMPARFVRAMLCLRRSKGRLRRAPSCPSRARFDVLAHHPYSVGAPTRRALNPDDVSIPDLGKLMRLLRAAERLGTALPRKRHRTWVTEVSYDSSPPDPLGVPATRHARFLEHAFYLLSTRSRGFRSATSSRSRATRRPSSRASTSPTAARRSRSGRFGFRSAERAARGVLRAWGRAPVAGSVRIERRAGSGWRRVRSVRAAGHGTFLVRIATRSRMSLRARVGDETSLTWPAT